MTPILKANFFSASLLSRASLLAFISIFLIACSEGGDSNEAPTANAGVDQVVDEFSAVNLNSSSTDTDGTVDTYQWQQINGTSVVINNANQSSASFSAPGVTLTDNLLFRLTVTDDDGDSGSDEVTITVNPLVNPDNESPTANAGANQVVNEFSTVDLSGSGTDTDGMVASYQWQQISGTPVFINDADQSSASFSAPDVAVTENLLFRLTVTDDDGDSGSGDVTISVNPLVNPGNESPTANAGDDQAIDELTTVNLSGSGTDTDGTVDTYQWQQINGTSVVISNAGQANASFSAPDVTATENLLFRLTVTDDDGDSGSEDVTITVNPVITNESPTANAGNDQAVDELTTVNLSGSGTDTDGTVDTYQWQQINGTSVVISNAGQANASFSAPDVTATEDLLFRLTVTDDDGDSGSDDVSITVNPIIANESPTANAGGDQAVDEFSAVNLSGSATDTDGTVATYQWQQINGTSVVINNADQANASFSAPDVTTTEDLLLRLTVTDDDGDSGVDDVTITVNPVANANVSPTANAGADQAVDEFSAINLSGSGTDTDGTVDTYQWQQINGTSVVISNAGQASASFSAPDVAATEDLLFRLTVTDDDGDSGVDDVTITVNPAVKLNQGLVAHYPFDDNSTDASGNGRDGTEFGSLSYTTGVIGQALSLDGIDDYVRIPHAAAFDSGNIGTICSWIQNDATADPDVIVSKYQDNTAEDGYLIRLSSAGPLAFLKTDNEVDTSQADASHTYGTDWFHFCLVNTGDQAKAFLNGTEAGSGNNLANAFTGNVRDVLIGAKHSSGVPAVFFDGNLDDLRFYDRVLSDAEIQSLNVCDSSDASQHDMARANSYDNAWEAAWVANAQTILSTAIPNIPKTSGKVLQVGDSMTFSFAYGLWPRSHVGATTDDLATISWMFGDVSNANNGWDWSSNGTTAYDNASWWDILVDSIVVDTRFNDAQFAVILYNVPTFAPINMSIVEQTVNKYIDAGIVPILSTIPPRTDPTFDIELGEPYNIEIRAFAQLHNLPLIDYKEEIILRRPNGTWENTLISGDGVHPSGGVNGYDAGSDPYLPGGDPTTHTTGDAALNSGYLLRTWLAVQKMKEIKKYVVDGAPVPSACN